MREDDLLRDLTEQGLDLPAQSPSSRRPTLEEEVLDEIKDVLRDIDPRDSLDLSLPGASDNATDAAESSSTREAIPSAGAPRNRPGAAGQSTLPGSPRPEQPRGTIEELGDLLWSLISDFRLYAYLLLSLGAIGGVFVVVAIFKRQRDQRRRRRAHRRGSRKRRSSRQFRGTESRRRTANRDLAHP